MSVYYTTERFAQGDKVACVINLTELKTGVVMKFKSSVPPDKDGNVLVCFDDGTEDWLLGCNVYSDLEKAKRVVTFNKKNHGE